MKKFEIFYKGNLKRKLQNWNEKGINIEELNSLISQYMCVLIIRATIELPA